METDLKLIVDALPAVSGPGDDASTQANRILRRLTGRDVEFQFGNGAVYGITGTRSEAKSSRMLDLTASSTDGVSSYIHGVTLPEYVDVYVSSTSGYATAERLMVEQDRMGFCTASNTASVYASLIVASHSYTLGGSINYTGPIIYAWDAVDGTFKGRVAADVDNGVTIDRGVKRCTLVVYDPATDARTPITNADTSSYVFRVPASGINNAGFYYYAPTALAPTSPTAIVTTAADVGTIYTIPAKYWYTLTTAWGNVGREWVDADYPCVVISSGYGGKRVAGIITGTELTTDTRTIQARCLTAGSDQVSAPITALVWTVTTAELDI